MGMRIATVSLSGQRQVSREEIFAAAGVTDHSSLLFLDVADARAKLEAIPWIAEATVRKLYPDRLQITVTEREAVRAVAAAGQGLGDRGRRHRAVREGRAAARLAAVRGRQRRGREARATSSRCSTSIRRSATPCAPRSSRGAALEPAAEERHRRAPAGDQPRGRARQRWRGSIARRICCSRATSRRSTCASPTGSTVRLSDAVAQAREEAIKKDTKKKGGDA